MVAFSKPSAIHNRIESWMDLRGSWLSDDLDVRGAGSPPPAVLSRMANAVPLDLFDGWEDPEFSLAALAGSDGSEPSLDLPLLTCSERRFAETWTAEMNSFDRF